MSSPAKGGSQLSGLMQFATHKTVPLRRGINDTHKPSFFSKIML